MLYTLIIIVHVFICFLMIGAILLQSGKGAEIGASFGGSSQTVFGSRGPANFLNGKGIDPEVIKTNVIEKGLISADKAKELTRQEILNLIFIPGFSTAEVVTNISGRGVEMDVAAPDALRVAASLPPPRPFRHYRRRAHRAEPQRKPVIHGHRRPDPQEPCA